MAPPDLGSLLTTVSTATASHTELQDSVEIVVQLVETLTAQELHHPTLQSLSPSLPSSLLSLLLVLPSSLLPLLGALLNHSSTERLPFLYSKDNAKEGGRFRKKAERAGEAVEKAVEGVLRGLKGYVDGSNRENKISKEDRNLVGEHCFGPLVALLSPSKLRMALKRKVLDIIDYSISHHPSNKRRLFTPALLGARGLGRILADSEDYGLTERALELGWRLKDSASGKEKKAKWDEALWKALGTGKQEDEIRRRWKGVKKGTYLDDAADILALLSARDLSRYQNVHALTLTANSHTFVESPLAPRSASYDQSVSFDRVGFTATTTREIGEDDAVQQDLELEFESVERVLVEQAGDTLSVRIISFQPPTLDSIPLPLSIETKDKEHHISFTMRAEDGPKLAAVLDARELLWESSVDLNTLAQHDASLPTPKKTQLVAVAPKNPENDIITRLPAAPNISKSNSEATAALVEKQNGSKPRPSQFTKSKADEVSAPAKPPPNITSSSHYPSNRIKPVSAPLGAVSPSYRPPAPPPGKPRFSDVAPPLPQSHTGAKRKPKGVGGGREKAVSVVVGRALKRKAGDEEEVGDEEEYEEARQTKKSAEKKGESRKKQRVGAELEWKTSKSVAFEQKSPVTKRFSTSTSPLSPARNLGARSPHRSPAIFSPYRKFFTRADDSGFGSVDETAQRSPDKLDRVGGIGGAECEEEGEEDEGFGEMLSQMIEGKPKKEAKKLLERLRRYDAEEEDETMEESGREFNSNVEEPFLPAIDSPSHDRCNLSNATHKIVVLSPRADFDVNQHFPALRSPSASLCKRIGFGGAPLKARKTKRRPEKKEQGTVGGQSAAKREDSKKKNGKRRNSERGEKRQDVQGVEDLVTAERDQMAHDEIGRTLMALSAVVLDNFQQGRMKANGKFGASKARIGDKVYRLGMHLHQSTTAISSATQDEVSKLKTVTVRLQQLAGRSRAFGDRLTKEMSA